ncbi:MAG: hypothetical protein ACRD0U_01495 [Acidimicrobiales bacterium]
MHRRLAMFAFLAVAVAAAACNGGDGGSDRATGRRADQARQAAAEAGLDDDVQEILALAASGLDATYQVTFETTGEGEGESAQLVVSQRPPDRRLDLIGADGATATSLFVDDAAYQCSKPADGEWECVATAADTGSSAPGVFDEDTLASTIAELAASRTVYDFSVERRQVAGVDASCLVTELRPGREPIEGQGESGTLCFSGEGAIVVVEQPGERAAASAYTTDLPADLFNLPARPSAATTTSPG